MSQAIVKLQELNDVVMRLKLGFKACLIFKPNLELALLIILKQRKLCE